MFYLPDAPLDWINLTFMTATIISSAAGYLAPRFTMEKLDLKASGSALGFSEIRAASSALFIGLGFAAILINAKLL